MQIFQQSLESIKWVSKNLQVFSKVTFTLLILAILLVGGITQAPGLSSILLLLWLFLVSMVMVNLHRFILLDQDSNPIKIINKPDKSVFIYFGYWILFNFAERLVDLFLSNVNNNDFVSILFFNFLVPLLFSYFFLRLYMVYPAISVGKNLDYAWSLSKGNSFKIIFSALVFFVCLAIPILILYVIIFFSLSLISTDLLISYVESFSKPNLYFIYFLGSLFLMMINVHFSLIYKLLDKEEALVESQTL